MSKNLAFGTQLIGQTEKALGAILDRLLAGTGVSERQWVALRITAMSGGTVARDELIRRVAAALKVTRNEAGARIDELAAAGLVDLSADAPAALTAAGQELHDRILGGTSAVTQRLWGDLPADELETAARVLATVLARAYEEVAAAPAAA
jgi:DNA-binding MarR family transcriptional regulator